MDGAPRDRSRSLRRRETAPRRALRDARIVERVERGLFYEDIARDEKLSVRRVRAIVARMVKSRRADPPGEHAHLQKMRLAPSLRLAARAVAEGDLRAIDRMLRLLDRLDRYNGAGAQDQIGGEEVRERLERRLARMAHRFEALRLDSERRHRNALARLAALGVDEQTAGADPPAAPGVDATAAAEPRASPGGPQAWTSLLSREIDPTIENKRLSGETGGNKWQ